MQKRVRILGLLIFGVALLAVLSIPRVHTGVSAQTQHKTHRDRKHMHMKNWMLEPTGITGVNPLDPASIPKYVTQLTKPPIHVPIGTQTDPETGKKIPLYEVTEKVIQAQLLPAGYPTRKVYAYGGLVNFNATARMTTSEQPQPSLVQLSKRSARDESSNTLNDAGSCETVAHGHGKYANAKAHAAVTLNQ